MRKLTISHRQWQHIQAALCFWNSVTEHSRVLPENHPKVAAFFEAGAPLSIDEIKQLLKHISLVSECSEIEIGEAIKPFAASRGLPASGFYSSVKKMGVQPIGKIGTTHLYRWIDLDRIAHIIEKHIAEYVCRNERGFRHDVIR